MISDLYDALVIAFRKYHCPAKLFLGAQYKGQHTGDMAVILYQDDDTFGPPNPASVPEEMRKQFLNPRPVATRVSGFVAELWASAPIQTDATLQYRADLAYLDALINQFGCALNQLAIGTSALSGGAAARGNADSAIRGLGYALKGTFNIPIIECAWPAQQLDRCTRTWAEAAAKAAVTVSGKVDPEPPYYQPGVSFPVPTEE